MIYVKPGDSSLFPKVVMLYDFLMSRYNDINILFDEWMIVELQKIKDSGKFLVEEFKTLYDKRWPP